MLAIHRKWCVVSSEHGMTRAEKDEETTQRGRTEDAVIFKPKLPKASSVKVEAAPPNHVNYMCELLVGTAKV